MRKTLITAFLILGILSSFSYAQEEEKVKIITGKLTEYGKNFVAVNGKKLMLCPNYMIVEESGAQITLEGLIATEAVMATVNIKKACATEVKVLQVRE